MGNATQRKSEANRRTASVHVMVRRSERELMERAADHEGLSISQWLRRVGVTSARTADGARAA